MMLELGKVFLAAGPRHGLSRVWTPHITKLDLYKASGHYAKFDFGITILSILR